MEDVSDYEIVKIATNFLLNSPPGEFADVLTDVRGLILDKQLLNAAAPQTFRQYNIDQMTPVQSPHQKHQMLITKHGEVGEGEYLDPRGKQVVLFDHLRQEVTGARPLKGELDADVEPFRAAFDEAVNEYVQEHYPLGAYTVYGRKEGNEYKITIAISASKYSPTNYWNGRWRSTWQIGFSPSGGEAIISGMVQVQVHYYEEGNVQLNNTFEKQLQSAVGDSPAATAANALKAIVKTEHTYHNSLDSSYVTMGGTTFKALRRILPITVQKIDWNKIRSYRIAAEIAR